MSRRAWLGFAGVIAAAATGGVLVAFGRPDAVSGHPPGPPDWLPAALAREQQLLAGIDAAGRVDATLRVRLAALRADHVAHLQVLRDLAARYGGTSATSRSTGSQPPSPTTSHRASTGMADVRRAELAASRATAAAALTAAGGDAGLLASIAACEATHAEVLSR
jgi:hypothetical protein